MKILGPDAGDSLTIYNLLEGTVFKYSGNYFLKTDKPAWDGKVEAFDLYHCVVKILPAWEKVNYYPDAILELGVEFGPR